MGHRTTIPSAGSFASRKAHNDIFFNRIHVVSVLEVSVSTGKIVVGPPVDEEIDIPLLGLSATQVEGDINFESSSWGRYIPQQGDILLVAYSSAGTPYALGYTAVQYKNFEVVDRRNEDIGGIGWGPVVEKNIKPGDWDFKSSRGSQFYLGDRASLVSGTCSVSLLKDDQELSLRASLVNQSAGSSKIRYGNARRLVLPTDFEESYIYAPLERTATIAQEFAVDMRWNSGIPGGSSLAYFGLGDVVDDLTKTTMVSGNTFPVRMYFSATDQTGLLTSYEETVDSMGNYDLSANLATSFKWLTPLAEWDITNLNTSITSTVNIDLSATAFCNITGTGGVVLDSSALVQLGGSSSTEPFVLGSQWLGVMQTLINIVMAHTHPIAGATAGTSVDAGVSGGVLLTNLASCLSTKVMGS